MKKNILLFTLIVLISSGCGEENIKKETVDTQLIHYTEALELFEEGMEAEVLDIETGITYSVRRIEGGFDTLADVETLSLDDTDKLLETAGGDWNIIRRAVIVTVGEFQIAGSISPFAHSGDENYEYGQIIDNRSGSTGSGINLDSIRGNGMTGVVDIYFHNSLIPGVNRVDERHQEMVLEAYEYQK